MAGLSLLASLVVVGLVARAWGDRLEVQERLLPGVTIAGVEVGERTTAEALAAVRAVVEPRLDRELTITHEGLAWHTTPAELGATSDATEVIDAAFAATTSASWHELARYRWLGHGPDVDPTVTIRIPEDEGAAFVDTIAARIDREPLDATIAWRSGGLELLPDRHGRRVDREATLEALHVAANGGAVAFALPHDVFDPDVSTVLAARAFPAVRSVVDDTLDRPVALTYGDERWRVSARDLDAVPELAPVVSAAVEAVRATSAGPSTPRTVPAVRTPLPTGVVIAIPDDSMADLVAELAGAIDRAAENARIAWTGTGLAVTPERLGVALDQALAEARVRSALRGEAEVVELPVDPVEAAVTTASFRRVLVVRQDLRELHLYEDGDVARAWPVAVGMGGSPTPTGVFTVGAKRHRPTWYNPAPDGWGRHMPRVIGPGPDNPLGVRALNWDRGGHDTLIRFHGTPNEASIGQAASRGCVRLRNADVVELYDTIPSGTAIVSVAG